MAVSQSRFSTARPVGNSAALRRILLSLFILCCALSFSPAASATDPAIPANTSISNEQSQQIWQLKLQGVIGPASSDLLIRTIDEAELAPVHLLLVTLDTPGGLMSSMRAMIHRILASRVPIVIYVHPKGARAASAGTYLLYASHLAAMSPATNLGAATPIQMGMPARPGAPPGEKDNRAAPQPSALEKKVINDAVAHIRGLAELHGRNADWAEQAVREGVSLDARAALAQSVIEVVANDVADLLKQIEGREIQLNNQTLTLSPAGLDIVVLELDWRYEFLSTITNPNVAYILMLIGFYGLLLEFYNPGVGLPGVVGAISLLTALYALQLLPINYAGLALIILGLGLMMAEAFSPSFGILGLGGLVAFVLGSILLMDTEVPDFQIALPLVAAFSLLSGLVCMLLLAMALKSRNTPVASGVAMLVGETAMTLNQVHTQGKVQLHGEIWFARSNTPIAPHQPVIVSKVDGLILDVSPVLARAHPEER